MNALRKVFNLSVLLVLLFASACGAAAPTAAPPAATAAPPAYEGYVEEPAAIAPPANAPPDSSYAPQAYPTQSAGDEPYDMFFEDYGVNPSIDTEDDNLSTFALDVDTGSYTIARN